MPRIPVRVEPYSSPSRQHRHYKNKRDQVLRALGKAAYINGSHFAIMWVSARGDVETYASEALQSRLDDWFVAGGIAEEAKELVKVAGGKPASKVFDDSEDDEENEDPNEDPFLDSQVGAKRKVLAPLNTVAANQHFLRSRSWNDEAPKSAPLFPTSSAGFVDEPPRTSTPIMSASSRMLARNSISGGVGTAAGTPTVDISLADEAARTAFLELRFGQLQQGVCKTVAKAWIKIIEPKKQTRCPYNKGEQGKPDWWPAGVRHKEPDHLMKPERHALLLTILRSPKVQVARLQLATAEVVALIKADKVSLLMDVYRIAREEEKIREKGADKDTPLTVGVSTLDGWCASDNAPTTHGRQIARSATPEVAERKKRPAPAMDKGKGGGGKRRSIAAPTSGEIRPRHLAPQEAGVVGLGLMARSNSLSAMPTPAGSAETSPWPASYATFAHAHGLVTPLTASATLDPAFAAMAHPPPHEGTFYYPPPPPPAQAFYESIPPHAIPPPPATHHQQPDANAGLGFEPNALGLEGWNFALDMSAELSTNTAWSGDNSFSIDSIPAPKTPEAELRINMPHNHQHKPEFWMQNQWNPSQHQSQ